MFVGSINQDLRGLLAELAPKWRDRLVYVGCSGNFTVERILHREGVRNLLSNDISLYSCVLGSYLAGLDCPVTLKENEGYDWMRPYMQPGVALIAHLLLTMEYVKFTGRVEPYHKRMEHAYRVGWYDLHAKTVKRVSEALEGMTVQHFFAGDVVEHVRNAPQDCVCVSFPPTYVGGYEKLYEKFADIFEWQPPEYTEFTPERFAELTALMQEKQTWVTLRDEVVPDLQPFCIGSFQNTPRSKTVYVYAGERDKARITIPAQKVEGVPMGRLEGTGSGPLRLVRLTGGQMNSLRSQYLAVGIAPAGVQFAVGLTWGDKLVGAIGFSTPQMGRGDWCDLYLVSDFSVRPTVYARLSKLVLAAIQTTELQAIAQQALNRRIRSIGTTAFTKNPVSMKYRGSGFELYSRKDGALNYTAQAGRWSLEQALAWWLKNHGAPNAGTNAPRVGGRSIDGDAALPSAEAVSKPAVRSTDEAQP